MRTLRLLATASLFLALAGCGGIRFMAKDDGAPRTAPADKALVNFVRPSNWGGGEDLPIFDGHKLIGNVEGKMIFPYLATPGEHWFIANKGIASVVKADLKAGQVYDIAIDIAPGAFSANVFLSPITKASERRGKVADWDKLPRYRFADSADAGKFESKRSGDIDAILKDFKDGSKKDRVKALAADDHR
jgi:hypothetical protein